MQQKLEAARDAVTDERSFLEFLTILATDWQTERELEASAPSSPALGWENGQSVCSSTQRIVGVLLRPEDFPSTRRLAILGAGWLTF
ncbi:hypothetical protein [Ralstonia pseudosolanacearum]|uniref:hypothetical protein n=1 Tax=Ralstonia pseudosolanacearum TaxID=1310165 RepID=UPI001FF81D7D|nr:hypothetical protein [Ralstonia pseudosolanacearum]